MDNLKFVVDQIIDDVAILENLDTKEKVEENIYNLPQNLRDGNVLKLYNGIYILDSNTEEYRRRMLRERIDRLKKISKEKN